MSRFALLVAFVLVSGCDSVLPPAPSSPRPVTVALHGQLTGDAFYHLAPVAAGETFVARLDGADGAVELRHRGVGGGHGVVELAVQGQSPSSVTVEYVADGVVLGSGPALRADTAFTAGQSEDGPDSWHYVQREDGTIDIEYDYNESGNGTGTTSITTPDGSTYEVTHVRFVLEGADLGWAERLTFDAPSTFALK